MKRIDCGSLTELFNMSAWALQNVRISQYTAVKYCRYFIHLWSTAYSNSRFWLNHLKKKILDIFSLICIYICMVFVIVVVAMSPHPFCFNFSRLTSYEGNDQKKEHTEKKERWKTRALLLQFSKWNSSHYKSVQISLYGKCVIYTRLYMKW